MEQGLNTETHGGTLSQYLTFEVSGDEYAIGVLDAREINDELRATLEALGYAL